MAAPITVLLGQFEDLVAHGLRAILSADERIELLATDIPIASLEGVVAEVEPDVAVLDFRGLRSPVEVHRLSEAQPETHLIVIVDQASPAECGQLLAFGATAVITRDTDKDDLLTAIRLASRGMKVMPGAAGDLSREPLGPDLLTAREAQVLELLQLGRSNAEIAHELTVGLETVRTHARNIYRKLGVTSRKELAAVASPYGSR